MLDPDASHHNPSFDYFYRTEKEREEVVRAAEMMGFKITFDLLEKNFASFNLHDKEVYFFKVREDLFAQGQVWEHVTSNSADEIVCEIVGHILS